MTKLQNEILVAAAVSVVLFPGMATAVGLVSSTDTPTLIVSTDQEPVMDGPFKPN